MKILLIMVLMSGLLAYPSVYADDDDDDNNSEINYPPEGVPIISGIAEPGQVLTVSTSNISDANGLGPFSYRWLRNGRAIKGKKAKKTSYNIVHKDLNARISVVVKYTDGGGRKESVVSVETAVVGKVNVPGVISISGTAIQGVLLTANVSDANGFGPGSVGFRWKRGGSDIAGATASTYTLVQADVEKFVSVTVSYIDGRGVLETISSNPLGPVANVNDVGVVTVEGGAIDGSVLTVTDIADADGLSNSNFSYQWLRNGAVIGNASNSYTVVSSDVGLFITVVVTYIDDFGTAEVISYVVGAIRPDLPNVMAPPPLGPINATGWFTLVTLDPGFAATAFDTLDISSLTATTASSGQFRPGVSQVTWTATDSAGNVGTATQTVSVVPLAEISKIQRIAEGSSAAFTISLNGNALKYPVRVPYTVSGTADAGNHDLVTAIAEIKKPTDGEVPKVEISFTTITDDSLESSETIAGNETIIVTLEVPDNAVLGLDTVHIIEIIEDNVPPLVRLEATQLQVDANSGEIIVFANASDANADDILSYDWSGTDNAIPDAINVTGEMFSFNANALAPGFYVLHVEVDDGLESASSALLLNVVPSLTILDSNLDSDADGTVDSVEGYTDSDGDGVADYLDAIVAEQVIQIKPGVSNAFIMQTEPGLKLSLGDFAIKAGLGGSLLAQEILTRYSVVTGVEGENEAIDSVVNVGGYFDFTVTGLPVAGQSIHIVIPQIAAMPRASVYRKLVSPVISEPSAWQDYVQDAKNSVASAAGEEGYCPPPGDPAYTAGLNEGHWCLQLTIEDGGPNDSDGLADNRVADPGGIGRVLSSVNVVSSGSSGAWNPLLLVLSVFILLALRNKKVW